MANTLNCRLSSSIRRESQSSRTSGISDAEHVKDAGDRKDAPSGNSKVSVKEQKIAINLGGVLCSGMRRRPADRVKRRNSGRLAGKDVTKATGPEDLLVLGRFANATWKAGQPFINWDRIKNDHFISANYLPEESTQKDYAQVVRRCLQIALLPAGSKGSTQRSAVEKATAITAG